MFKDGTRELPPPIEPEETTNVPLEDALKEGPEGPEDALLPRVALPAEGPEPEAGTNAKPAAA